MTMNQFIPTSLIGVGRQPRTQQERDKAKRIWAAYRWTWDRYWQLGVKQGWKCGICGRSASNSALNGKLDGLNIDHIHFHVRSERLGMSAPARVLESLKWIATVDEFPEIVLYGMTKKGTEAVAREIALPKSVRGLLCPGRHGKAGHGCCNRLLGRVDNIEWLEASAGYLRNPPAKGLQF
jgi:hypothetical protein